MRQLLLVIVLSIAFTFAGCGAGYVVHPGAYNQSDSIAADTLTQAQTAIETARDQIKSGALKATPGISSALIAMEKVYNVARPAYLSWRDAVSKGQPTDVLFTNLQNDITQLTNAIAAFRKAS